MTKRKSPYQRHNKAPYKYSEIYQLWKAAVLAGRDHDATKHARAHYARFVLGAAPMERAA